MSPTEGRPVVVVGLDDGDMSERALDTALTFASPGGVVHVVWVIGGFDPLGKLEYAAETHRINVDKERDELAARLDRLLGAWQATSQTAAPTVKPMVLVGPVKKELLRVARGVHADLICVGTQGRTGMGRVVLGSVAEAVVRAAPCSVWIEREKAW